jgi:hypothetical protein
MASAGGSWTFDNGISFTVISPFTVSNGLVFYTRFNECNNTVVSSSVGSNVGDMFGPVFSSDVIPGSSGCTMEFVSQDKDYVQFPTNPFSGLSTTSVSFWLKTLSGNANILGTVSSSYNLEISGSKFYSNGLGLSMDGYLLTNYLDGSWHHFVLVQNDNGNAKLYIDGSFKYERSVHSFSSNSGTGLFLGRNYSQYDPFFNGKMDNVRIYNRALSITEVTQIYNAKQ